jgi:hypothetical protein
MRSMVLGPNTVGRNHPKPTAEGVKKIDTDPGWIPRNLIITPA